MENIVQFLIENITLWAPKVGGVLAIFLIFLILAKIVKRLIIKSTERLELDKNLLSPNSN